MGRRHSLRAVLLLGAATMKRQTVGRSDGRTVIVAAVLVSLLSFGPTVRRSDGQDTSAIDRGVRIGIVYRPGARPGLVMLPRSGQGLDSVRTMVARDLDYSDRFEVITLPGGDSIRLAGTTGTRRSRAG